MAAADPDNVSSAEDLLAIGMRAAHDGRPAGDGPPPWDDGET
jgi:hypothetical protein